MVCNRIGTSFFVASHAFFETKKEYARNFIIFKRFGLCIYLSKFSYHPHLQKFFTYTVEHAGKKERII